jgi:hypothetical protein
MNARSLAEYCGAHTGGILFVALGICGVLYSLLAKRISFQGDFPLMKEERKLYVATPAVRRRALAISLLPLAYGIVLLMS